MSNCEGSRTTPSGCPWDNLLEAAMNLRTKQRSYMADRGNEEKGRAVGDAARVLDDAIEYALVAQSEKEPWQEELLLRWCEWTGGHLSDQNFLGIIHDIVTANLLEPK